MLGFLSRRVSLWTVLLVLAVPALVAAYALAAWRYHWPPVAQLSELKRYVEGVGEVRRTTLWEKLSNDFGYEPARYTFPRQLADRFPEGRALAEDGIFRDDRLLPRSWQRDGTTGATPADDLVLVYGVFEFGDSRFGSVLIDPSAGPNGRIVRYWPTLVGQTGGDPDKNGFDPISGLQIVKHTAGQVAAISYCGEELWAMRGSRGVLHHSIEFTRDGTAFWMLEALDAVKYDLQGRELKRLAFNDLMVTNPQDGALRLRLWDRGWTLDSVPRWGVRYGIPRAPGIGYMSHFDRVHDPLHVNDAQPVPASFFPEYPGELVGLSYRNIDLVMIADVDTAEIVARIVARTSRQHDIDFNDDGTVTIFDNNVHVGDVRIVEWDIEEDAVTTVFDASVMEQENVAHGNHTKFGRDGYLIVDFKGRVYTVEGGEPRWILENTYDDAQALVLRNAWLLPRANYERLEARCN